MIKRLITFFLVLMKISLFAQSNLFKLKTGKIFYGSGDIWGINSGITYEKKLNNSFNLYCEYAINNGTQTNESSLPDFPEMISTSVNKATALDLGLGVSFYKIQLHTLKLNLGVSYLMNASRLVLGSFSINPNQQIPNQPRYIYDPPIFKKANSIGGNIGLQYSYNLSIKSEIGLGVNTQFYRNGWLNHNFCISLGYKL